MATKNTKATFNKTKVNAASWVGNVGKSLGYSTFDLLKDIMPATFDTIDANADGAKELVDAIKSIKGGNTLDLASLIQGKAKDNIETAKLWKKNALEDIRSGQFNNNDSRMKKEQEDEWGLGDDGFEFSMDDSFSDDNFDAADGDAEVVVPNVIVKSNITKNNPMVKAVNAQTDVMISTAEAGMEQDFKIATASMALDRRIGEQLGSGLVAINDNLSVLVKFQSETMSNYIGASMRYYEENLRIVNETLAEYKRVNPPAPEAKERKESAYDTVFSSSGGFNLKEYGSVLKKQLKTYVEGDMFLGAIVSMFEDTDTLRSMAMNPLRFISDGIVKKIFPAMIRETLTSFDDSFKEFLPAMFMKINKFRESDNYLLKAFGEIFGLKSDLKRSVNTSVYNKGPVPFDGVVHKAITTVIPGYLSKILGALQGPDSDLVFNYETGKFTSSRTAKNEWINNERSRALGAFEDRQDVKDVLQAYRFENAEDNKKLSDAVDDLLIAVSRSGGLVNPRVYKDKNGDTKDDFTEILQDKLSGNEIEMIRNAVLSLDKHQIQRMFGRNAFESRAAVTDLYDKAENSNDSIGAVLYSGLYGQVGTKAVKPTFTQGEDSKSIFTPKDKYGKNSLSYLHDITKILLKGVGVFLLDRFSGEGENQRIDTSTTSALRAGYASKLKEFSSKKTRLETEARKYKDKENGRDYKPLSDTEKARAIAEGRIVLESTSDLPGDDSIQVHMRQYREKILEDNRSEDKTLGSELRKYFIREDGSTISNISEIVDKVLRKPQEILKGTFDKLNQKMFDLVFGKDDGTDEKHPPFFVRLLDNVQDKFESFHNYLKEHIFDPIKEALFGNEGLFTKFKDSEFFAKMKDMGSRFGTYLFGAKNVDGIREGGLFSDTANEINGMVRSVKEYFVGTKENRDDSVFGQAKGILKEIGSSIKIHFFGENKGSAKEQIGGVIGGFTSALKDGFSQFSEAIFGPKEVNGVTNKYHLAGDEMVSVIKERAPKALGLGVLGAGAGLIAGGNLGLLGSLFLPGGPIGGAIVGTALGFLSQSDRFKDWLFGDKDPENNNERIGGFINKSTQDFFKKNKTAMIAGGTLGALKGILGIGILPGFILGGPIGGALLGIGASLVYKSEKFQNFMFGNDKPGEEKTGIITKLMGRANSEDGKKRFGAIGAGLLGGAGLGAILSNFGVLGAFAFGPIGGAVAGTAAGIALTSDKWKKALFGEMKTDEDGEIYRSGGLLGKFTRMMQVEVLQPLKIKFLEYSFGVQEWFDEHIAEPFLDSLAPIKEEIARFKQRVSDFFTNLKDSIVHSPLVHGIKSVLIDPILEGFRENVFDPFKRLTDGLIKGAANITGKVLSAPFKMLNAIADRLELRHRREGLKAYRAQIIQNIKNTDFVQGINEYVLTPAKDMIRGIGDFAKDTIKSTFSLFGKLLKWGATALFNTAGTIITAPFKLISSPFKLAKFVADSIRGISPRGVGDQDRLDSINSGNRGFLQSMADLALTFVPFSGLRNDAQYSQEGAHYAGDRDAERERRKQEREERKRRHRDILSDLKNKSDANRELARSLGYDVDGPDGENYNAIYKDLDKQLAADYGKRDWRKLSKVEKDDIKRQRIRDINQDKIKNAVEDIRDLIKNPNRDTNDPIDHAAEDLQARPIESHGDESIPVISPLDTNDPIVRAAEDLQARPIESHGDEAVPTFRFEDEDDARNIFENSNVAKATKAAMDINEDEEKSKKELADERAHVTRKNANFQLAALNAKSEEEREAEFKNTLLSRLDEGNQDRKEQKESWSYMFGKKGLIATGILLALPWIIKFFKDPAGFIKNLLFGDGDGGGILGAIANGIEWMNDNEHRRTADGTPIANSDFNESLVRGAVYGVQKVGPKIGAFGKGVFDAGKKVWDTGKSAVNVAKALFGKTAPTVADDVARGVVTASDDVLAEIAMKGFGSGSDDLYEAAAKSGARVLASGTDDVLEGAVQAADGKLITKFINMAKDALHKIFGLFTKKLPEAGKAKPTVMSRITSALVPKRLQKFLPKITNGTAKGAAKTGASVVSLGITDALFATWGGITGAFEAGRLFAVPPDRVDGTMRTISGILKGVLNVSWLFVIDILNDIITELTGMDLLRYIAVSIYKAIMDDAADARLDDAQGMLESEWYAYNESQKALDPNYKEMSLDAYIDMTQKTVGQKIWDGTKKAYTATKDFLFGGDKYTTDEAGNQVKVLDKYGRAVKDRNIFQSYAATTGRATLALGTLGMSEVVRNWKDKTIYVTDENGNAILDESGNPIPIMATGKETPEEIVEMYGKGAYVDKDGTIKKAGVGTNVGRGLKRAGHALTAGVFDDEQIRGRFGLEEGEKITLGMRSASAVGNVLGKIPFVNTDKVAQFVHGVNLSINDWWNKDAVGPNGEPIIDPITQQPVKASGISNFFHNTIPSLGTHIGQFISDMGKGIKNWWETPIKDWNGNEIIFPIVQKSASPGEIPSIIKESFGRVVGGIGDFGRGIWKSVIEWWETPIKDWSGNEIVFPLINKTVTPGEVPGVIAKAFGSLFSPITDVINKAWKAATDWWEAPIKDLSGKSIVFPGVNKTVSPKDIGSFLLKSLNAVLNPIGSLMSGLSSVGSAIDDIVSKYTGGDGLFSGIKGWINKMIERGRTNSVDGEGGPLGVGGPMDIFNTYKVTSKYGTRILNGARESHNGVDLTKKNNEPVMSFTDGVVTKVVSGFAPNSGSLRSSGGYGNHVIIKDKNGKFHIYGHMNKVNSKVGDRVSEGTIIGLEGSTGRSTGPHLHYEVRNTEKSGSSINPTNYLKSYVSDTVAPSDSYTESVNSSTTTKEVPGTGLLGLNEALATAMADATAPLTSFTSALTGAMSSLYGTTASTETVTTDDLITTKNAQPGLSGSQSGVALVHRNLQQFNPISENELNNWIKSKSPNSPFVGNAKIFLDASNRTGLDPRYIVAHAALESGWGTSSIARNKNNYFGIGAFDSSPYKSAYRFGSGLAAGIIGGAEWIDRNYTEAGQNSLHKMRFNNGRHEYATDPRWADKIASIMNTAPGVGGLLDGDLSTENIDSLVDYTGIDRNMGAGIPESAKQSSSSYLRQILNTTRTSSGTSSDTSLIEKIIDILIEIASNTGSSSDYLKELQIKAVENINNFKNITNSVVTGNNSQHPMNIIARHNNNPNNTKYQTAKRIAHGMSY